MLGKNKSKLREMPLKFLSTVETRSQGEALSISIRSLQDTQYRELVMGRKSMKYTVFHVRRDKAEVGHQSVEKFFGLFFF